MSSIIATKGIVIKNKVKTFHFSEPDLDEHLAKMEKQVSEWLMTVKHDPRRDQTWLYLYAYIAASIVQIDNTPTSLTLSDLLAFNMHDTEVKELAELLRNIHKQYHAETVVFNRVNRESVCTHFR